MSGYAGAVPASTENLAAQPDFMGCANSDYGICTHRRLGYRSLPLEISVKVEGLMTLFISLNLSQYQINATHFLHVSR